LNKIIRWSLAASFLAVSATPAFAQDSCGDILKNGAFDSVDIASRSEYQEIIISRFLSSTYEGSKRTDSGIGGKSIGEMVMGSAYTKNEYDQKKATLRQSYDRTLTQTEEWSVATRTANPGIVKAWESCMNTSSGLLARFETRPGDGRNATLVLSFKPSNGVTAATIAGDTTLPAGVTFVSQNQFNRCLKNGAVITASAQCRVALIVQASQPVSIVISARQGDAEAYMGKRLRWNYTRKPFQETRERTLIPNQSSIEAGVISVPSEDVNAGFSFSPGSIQISGPHRYYGSGDGRCMNLSSTPTATQIEYNYLIISTDNMSTSCKLIVTAAIEKGEFVPDE